VWWCIYVIPVFGRLKQEDPEFNLSLGYIVRVCRKGGRKEEEKKDPFKDNSKGRE
jgi:hypothetical protein